MGICWPQQLKLSLANHICSPTAGTVAEMVQRKRGEISEWLEDKAICCLKNVIGGHNLCFSNLFPCSYAIPFAQPQAAFPAQCLPGYTLGSVYVFKFISPCAFFFLLNFFVYEMIR